MEIVTVSELDKTLLALLVVVFMLAMVVLALFGLGPIPVLFDPGNYPTNAPIPSVPTNH